MTTHSFSWLESHGNELFFRKCLSGILLGKFVSRPPVTPPGFSPGVDVQSCPRPAPGERYKNSSEHLASAKSGFGHSYPFTANFSPPYDGGVGGVKYTVWRLIHPPCPPFVRGGVHGYSHSSSNRFKYPSITTASGSWSLRASANAHSRCARASGQSLAFPRKIRSRPIFARQMSFACTSPRRS